MFAHLCLKSIHIISRKIHCKKVCTEFLREKILTYDSRSCAVASVWTPWLQGQKCGAWARRVFNHCAASIWQQRPVLSENGFQCGCSQNGHNGSWKDRCVDDITPQMQMLSLFNLLRGLSASNFVEMCWLSTGRELLATSRLSVYLPMINKRYKAKYGYCSRPTGPLSLSVVKW